MIEDQDIRDPQAIEGAIAELDRRGYNFAPGLRSHQLDIFKHIKESEGRFYVLNCSRRWGKSHLMCAIATGVAVRYPGAAIKYACTTTSDLEEIVLPIFEIFEEKIIKSLRPKFDKQKSTYKFPNGSTVKLAGVNNANENKLRGKFADLCLIDEAGFIDRLHYLIYDVMRPMFLGRKVIAPEFRKIILGSTPPPVPGHFYTEMILKAKRTGAFSHQTIFDNKSLTEEEIKEIIEDTGGVDSETFRREYLAEIVRDTKTSIIPEFDFKKKDEIVREHKRPEFFYPYTISDLGYVNDLSAELFCYYDFLNGLFIFEDELILDSETTKTIAEKTRKMEFELWGKHKCIRFADGDPRVIGDLTRDHHLETSVVPKLSLHARVNRARQLIQNNRVVINPKCEVLISHIENGIWDTNKKSFKRIDEYGHFDALAAFIYAVDLIDTEANPFPKYYKLNTEDHHIKDEPTYDDFHFVKEKDDAQKLFEQLTEGRSDTRKNFIL